LLQATPIKFEPDFSEHEGDIIKAPERLVMELRSAPVGSREGLQCLDQIILNCQLELYPDRCRDLRSEAGKKEDRPLS